MDPPARSLTGRLTPQARRWIRWGSILALALGLFLVGLTAYQFWMYDPGRGVILNRGHRPPSLTTFVWGVVLLAGSGLALLLLAPPPAPPPAPAPPPPAPTHLACPACGNREPLGARTCRVCRTPLGGP